jgi:hypothetical protein
VQGVAKPALAAGLAAEPADGDRTGDPILTIRAVPHL